MLHNPNGLLRPQSTTTASKCIPLYTRPLAQSIRLSRAALAPQTTHIPTHQTTQQAEIRETASVELTSKSMGDAAAVAASSVRTVDGRQQAKLAFLGAWIASGIVCFAELSQNAEQLPRVPDWVWQSMPGVCSTLMLMPLALKAVLGDKFHLELHRGRVWMQVGVPSQGPSAPNGSVIVRPTIDGRGNGAVAMVPLPAGTHLCDYEGELLTAQQYMERYTDGVSDFVMSVDDFWVLDAVHLVNMTSQFKAVHMNHSQTRANVVRYYNRQAQRIAFFTSRDIMPGEELMFNYGRDYWRGREHMELP